MKSHTAGHTKDVGSSEAQSLRRPDGQDPVPTLDRRVRDLFVRHADFVWRSLQRLGLDPARAEDGLQDVFLVVHRRIDDLHDRDAARAWLFAIARRVAADHRRSERRETRRRNGLLTVVSSEPADVPHDRHDAMRLLEQFLGGLDEDRRVVFHLMELEGMRAKEAAAALEVNVNTIYTRLRAARRAFDAFVVEHSEESQ